MQANPLPASAVRLVADEYGRTIMARYPIGAGMVIVDTLTKVCAAFMVRSHCAVGMCMCICSAGVPLMHARTTAFAGVACKQ